LRSRAGARQDSAFLFFSWSARPAREIERRHPAVSAPPPLGEVGPSAGLGDDVARGPADIRLVTAPWWSPQYGNRPARPRIPAGFSSRNSCREIGRGARAQERSQPLPGPMGFGDQGLVCLYSGRFPRPIWFSSVGAGGSPRGPQAVPRLRLAPCNRVFMRRLRGSPARGRQGIPPVGHRKTSAILR